MPTVLKYGPYRFYFFSHEPNEPPHIHIDREGLSAKFWLKAIALANNRGFKQKELNVLKELVSQHQHQFLDAWHGYFGA